MVFKKEILRSRSSVTEDVDQNHKMPLFIRLFILLHLGTVSQPFPTFTTDALNTVGQPLQNVPRFPFLCCFLVMRFSRYASLVGVSLERTLGSHCVLTSWCGILFCLVTDDTHPDHLIKVVSARTLHSNVPFSSLVNKCFKGSEWKRFQCPISHQTSNFFVQNLQFPVLFSES